MRFLSVAASVSLLGAAAVSGADSQINIDTWVVKLNAAPPVALPKPPAALPKSPAAPPVTSTSTSSQATPIPTLPAILFPNIHARDNTLIKDKDGLDHQTSKTSVVSFAKLDKNILDATIEIDDHKVFQQVRGLGGSLTDSSALVLRGLKQAKVDQYNKLMKLLFDPSSENHQSAGLNFIRIPIGSSDFSSELASNADKEGDNDLKEFKLAAEASGILEVLQDILKINPKIVIQALPWSPPHWMKVNNYPQITAQLQKYPRAKMMGGKLDNQHLDTYAKYLVKTVEEFQKKNITITFLGLQNSPLNQDFTFPSCIMEPKQMAQLGAKVRKQLNDAKLHGVKLTGFEHTWKSLHQYSNALRAEADVFDSYGTHCYKGDVSDQLKLHNDQDEREILLTECTGIRGSDIGGDLIWQTEHITLGAFHNWATVGAMWNIALDQKGDPKLPNSSSCKRGCRGIVTVQGDSYILNQEFFALGVVSKAIIAKDAKSPPAKYVRARASGKDYRALTVGAFATVNPDQTRRISTVMLNKGKKSLTVALKYSYNDKAILYTLPSGLTTVSISLPRTSTPNFIKKIVHL